VYTSTHCNINQNTRLGLCIELWVFFDSCGVSSCGFWGGASAATRIVGGGA